METLKPVEVSEFYIKRISSGLTRYFWENIFNPIFKILKDDAVYNDKSAVIEAINSGKIYYEHGAFRTKSTFNSEISKELQELGAVYRNYAYYIERSMLPARYEQAISFVFAKEAAKVTAINNLLINLSKNLEPVTVGEFIEKAVEVAFKKLEKDIISSAVEKKVPVIELGIVKPKANIPKAQIKKIEEYWKTAGKKTDRYINAPEIEIDLPALDEQSAKIAKDYVYNMQFWVKKWEVKNIAKMRQDVLKMVQDGARVPTIQNYFEQRWGIAKRKANFLALNESHLAASVIKATRYQQMGCKRFRWGRSTSKEKRKLHETYYGQVFEYANPPIIDEKLNIRGLPRQIWNCRCSQEPVIDRININEVINAKRNIFNKLLNHKQCDNYPYRYRKFGEG